MKRLFFLILFIFSANYSFSEVSSWVDNNPINVGDMFNLYVEAKNLDNTEEPDLSGIKGFKVINKSEQNKTTIIRNKITRTVKWTYFLLAETPGNFKIPSLKVGNEFTNPILLKVVTTSHNKSNKIVILDLNVSAKKVYPQ